MVTKIGEIESIDDIFSYCLILPTAEIVVINAINGWFTRLKINTNFTKITELGGNLSNHADSIKLVSSIIGN